MDEISDAQAARLRAIHRARAREAARIAVAALPATACALALWSLTTPGGIEATLVPLLALVANAVPLAAWASNARRARDA